MTDVRRIIRISRTHNDTIVLQKIEIQDFTLAAQRLVEIDFLPREFRNLLVGHASIAISGDRHNSYVIDIECNRQRLRIPSMGYFLGGIISAMGGILLPEEGVHMCEINELQLCLTHATGRSLPPELAERMMEF